MKGQTFHTHRGPVIGVWLGVVCLVGLAGYVVHLLTRFDGDFGPNPPFVFKAGFYAFVAFGAFLPLLRAWFLWRRLPRDPLGGRLVIDTTGLTFSMDDRTQSVPWSTVQSVHPVFGTRTKSYPSGLYLAQTSDGALSGMTLYRTRRRLRSTWTRPLDQPGGLVIPLGMFRRDETPKILATAQTMLSAAQKG